MRERAIEDLFSILRIYWPTSDREAMEVRKELKLPEHKTILHVSSSHWVILSTHNKDI
jgi:hypothetical protein